MRLRPDMMSVPIVGPQSNVTSMHVFVTPERFHCGDQNTLFGLSLDVFGLLLDIPPVKGGNNIPFVNSYPMHDIIQIEIMMHV